MLTYVARVKPLVPDGNGLRREEVSASLRAYIRQYRASCQALYTLVRELLEEPQNQLALYAVFLPAGVPAGIAESAFWRECVLPNPAGEPNSRKLPARTWGHPKKPAAVARSWPELNLASTAALLKVLANPTAQAKTRPAWVFQEIITRYQLRCPGLRARASDLKKILDSMPSRGEETAIGESVEAIVKSTLSHMEIAAAANRERAQVVAALEAEHPRFFAELRAWVLDMRVWQRACHGFQDLRRQATAQLTTELHLEAEEANRIVQACQRAAMRQAAQGSPRWDGLMPATALETQTAGQHPKWCARFLEACERVPVTEPFEADRFRRFSSADTPAIKLAEDAFFLSRIIDLYQAHVAPLSAATNGWLTQSRVYGRKTLHTGWQQLCRNCAAKTAEPDARRLYKFIQTQVRSWFRNIQPVRAATWAEAPDFWPRLDAGANYRWVEILEDPNAVPAEAAPGGASGGQKAGNELDVMLTIFTKDAQGVFRKQKVPVSLRGYLPADAEKIDPINVAHGANQYCPDRLRTQLVGCGPLKEAQHTYIKLQAMRLKLAGAGEQQRIEAHLSATQMTQALGTLQPANQLLAQTLAPGSRLGVLHLYPGGNQLAHLAVFEKVKPHPGWRQVTIEEIIPDTRRESYGRRHPKQRWHIQTQRVVMRPFVVFDETPHLRDKLRLDQYRAAKTDAQNHQAVLQEFGPYQANLSHTHYQQLAARIAKLCQRNRVGHLLVAGGGRLYGRLITRENRPVFVKAATKTFYTLQKVGGRPQPFGALVNACHKAGVTLLAGSGRARYLWMKPYLKPADGATPEASLHLCQSVTAFRQAGGQAIMTGTKRLIGPAAAKKGSYPFPLNAAWAILLDWSDALFQKHVDEAVEKDASNSVQPLEIINHDSTERPGVCSSRPPDGLSAMASPGNAPGGTPGQGAGLDGVGSAEA